MSESAYRDAGLWLANAVLWTILTVHALTLHGTEGLVTTMVDAALMLWAGRQFGGAVYHLRHIEALEEARKELAR